jgi:very-short-patch-repair endonuclease
MKKHPTDGARDRAPALRQQMTEAEKRIWQILRLRQIDGRRFRRHVPLGR